MEKEVDFDITKVNSTKSYVFFLSGQMVSLLGTAILMFSLIWWVTFTSYSDPVLKSYAASILGITTFASYAPMIASFFLSGVFIDRWNRKKIIFWINFIQALLSIILMILFFTKNVNLVIILIFLMLKGAFQGFMNPTIQAIVPLLVPKNKLSKINSFESSGTISVNLLMQQVFSLF